MAEILTPEAVAFVVGLQRTFNEQRKELLEARKARQKKAGCGERPDFLKENKNTFAESEWTVANCRRICLTGAWRLQARWNRKMIITAFELRR